MWIVLFLLIISLLIYLLKEKKSCKSSSQEKADRFNRQLKQIFLQSTVCGFAYIDTDFVIQFENLHGKRGLEAQNSSGKYCYQRIRGLEAPCENCVARKAMKSGKREFAKMRRDNACYEVTAVPVSEEGGTCVGVVLKYDNITVHEETIEKLQQAVKAAEAANKLHQQFLANMSHEIRTPLNAIVGFSDFLIEEPDEALKKEYIKIIRKNNHLLLQVIDDVLKQSILDSNLLKFTYSEISLNDLLKELDTDQIKVCKEGVNFVFRYQPEEHLVCTDVRMVREVLKYLIDNAIKFTHEGKIQVECDLRGEMIYFGVSDTGTGIPEEKQKLIFQRFVKIDPFVSGTGLGLSICQSVVEKMGGTIGVDSVEGEGSLFWFTIPVEKK